MTTISVQRDLVVNVHIHAPVDLQEAVQQEVLRIDGAVAQEVAKMMAQHEEKPRASLKNKE